MEVFIVPPSYSEAHARERAEAMGQLNELQLRMHADAKPILDKLAAIDACYPPKYQILPGLIVPVKRTL